MKISVIGTGYVGLVTGTCLAETGNEVICIDKDPIKLEKLKKAISPIYEPGLEELIKSNISEKRLSFSDNLASSIRDSLICFIAVGTPQLENGECDLSSVFEVAEVIGKNINGYKVIVNKSTAPVGTALKIKEIIAKESKFEFDVVSNPEFLKQGSAVDDFLSPDRIVIGSESKKATEIMQDVYSPFFRQGNRFVVMDIKSAEMTKYASNCFLATKISFINELSILCEKLGVNINDVRTGMSTDSRIGSKFLYPGIGYGGSCFPKDVKALIGVGKELGVNLSIIEAADKVNIKQRQIFVNKILKHFGNNLKNLKFAVWGLAFKPKTNDMREAPSITVIEELLKLGASVTAYDPKAIETAKSIFGNRVTFSEHRYEALEKADALLLITEWNEFRRPDFDIVKQKLNSPIIFDARNQYDPKRMKERGFTYCSFGSIL